MEENTRLRNRLQVTEAETGQKQTSSAEQDYEEVIQLLEAEIGDLKNQLAGKKQAGGVDTTKVSVSISVFTLPTLTLLYLMEKHCLFTMT